MEGESTACDTPCARFLFLSVPLTAGGSTLSTTNMTPSIDFLVIT
jgi:hypothetical protein